jgi:hypothetical protein
VFGVAAHAKVISQSDVPVCVRGKVTVTFSGDQATGCATQELCVYSGTETWGPQGAGDVGLLTVARDGHRATSATLVVGGLSTPAQSSVQRAGVTSTTACSDRVQAEGGGFFTLPVRNGRVDGAGTR